MRAEVRHMQKTIQDWLANPRSGTLSNFRVGYFAGARLLLPEEQEEWIEDMVIVGPREKRGKAKAPAGGPRVKGCKAKAPAVLSGDWTSAGPGQRLMTPLLW